MPSNYRGWTKWTINVWYIYKKKKRRKLNGKKNRVFFSTMMIPNQILVIIINNYLQVLFRSFGSGSRMKRDKSNRLKFNLYLIKYILYVCFVKFDTRSSSTDRLNFTSTNQSSRILNVRHDSFKFSLSRSRLSSAKLMYFHTLHIIRMSLSCNKYNRNF